MKSFHNFQQRLSGAIRNCLPDVRTRQFINHNKTLWSARKRSGTNRPEVLFEFSAMHSAIISYSYLANVLAHKYGARIVAYGFAGPFRWMLHGWLPNNVRRTYQSFNTSRFINVAVDHRQIQEARMLGEAAYARLKTTRDVEDLEVGGIWIGDLIYDSYLKSERVPTIDLKSPRFMASLRQSMEYFVFWRDYLETHDVKAINVSHCVYHLGIPLRIAVKRGIPVYQVNATHLYRMKEDYLFAYNDFLYFQERFRTLPRDVQESGLREAESRIKRRLAGEVGVDMPYSKKSAYGETQHKRVLRKSDRTKILIAAHCFFDSPHSYGKNLFPDFYEWLTFLGQISERTDYDWYLKTHPDYIPETKALIESFTRRFHKFTLLPSETSHHQLISEGIDVALTVYGTIGFEYAALGVTVINASVNNPHVAYRFNLHPRSVDEYEFILMNLDHHRATIDKAEVYEYYFMRFVHNTEDWLFNDYWGMLKELGGYMEQFTPRAYEVFLRGFSDEQHERIIKSLRTFVDSGDFRLDRRHCDLSFQR